MFLTAQVTIKILKATTISNWSREMLVRHKKFNVTLMFYSRRLNNDIENKEFSSFHIKK